MVRPTGTTYRSGTGSFSRSERKKMMADKTAPVTILNLVPENEKRLDEVAALLVEGFGEHWPEAWPDRASALLEVRDSLQPGRISRVAVDETGAVAGWVGGISKYSGKVWELHPLVVSEKQRQKGIGSALVEDLVSQVRQRGGLTVWLGSDDESGMTSLAGVDLFPGVLEHLRGIKNLKRHPYEFYLKLGFEIVGVMPDANGPGKPDIYLARPVR
jgi:aminoglycoside 6'-N-acetyltransferase I